jgi:hypothetical protein
MKAESAAKSFGSTSTLLPRFQVFFDFSVSSFYDYPALPRSVSVEVSREVVDGFTRHLRSRENTATGE